MIESGLEQGGKFGWQGKTVKGVSISIVSLRIFEHETQKYATSYLLT